MSPEDLRKNTNYVDAPEVSETFIDAVEMMFFDGNNLNVTLTVTRWDEPTPDKPPSGSRRTASRLVMAVPAAVELYNRLARVVATMQQQGLVKIDGPSHNTIQ